MQQSFSFKWYRAFRVIMLVLAVCTVIGGVLGGVLAAYFQAQAASDPIPPELAPVIGAIRSLAMYSLVLALVQSVLFFATWATLRRGSAAAVVLVIAQNVVFPVTGLAMIPVTMRYMGSMAAMLRSLDLSGGDLSGMLLLLNHSIPVAYAVGALITAAILLPNSIYFYKRRAVLHLADAASTAPQPGM